MSELWRLSWGCLEGVWKLSGGCLKGVYWLSEGCMDKKKLDKFSSVYPTYLPHKFGHFGIIVCSYGRCQKHPEGGKGLNFGDCLEGVQRVFGNCLEGVWRVSIGCLKGVCSLLSTLPTYPISLDILELKFVHKHDWSKRSKDSQSTNPLQK